MSKLATRELAGPPAECSIRLQTELLAWLGRESRIRGHVRARTRDLAMSAIAPGEQLLFAEFGTLALYDSLDESRPMTRAFQLAPVPEYALLSGDALIVATEQRLLVGTEGDDGSAEVHLAVPYPQITAVTRPDSSLSARRRELLSRSRLAGTSTPHIGDVHPPVEIRGENETIVLLLSPDHADDLFAAILQRSNVPVLPALPAE